MKNKMVVLYELMYGRLNHSGMQDSALDPLAIEIEKRLRLADHAYMFTHPISFTRIPT